MNTILMVEYIPSVETDKEMKIINYIDEIVRLLNMIDDTELIMARLGFLVGCYYGITDCDEDFNQSFVTCVMNRQYNSFIEVLTVHYADWCERVKV